MRVETDAGDAGAREVTAIALPRAARPLAPALSGASAVLGHTLEYIRSPEAFLQRGWREHGEVFRCRLGARWYTVVLGPEHNKFFFRKTDTLLSIRDSYPFFPRMFGKDFFFFAPNEEYMRQRAVVLPKFKSDAMRSYVAAMVEETEDLVDGLGDAGEFDLIPTLGPLVMNIAAHAFLGRDFRRRLDDGFFDVFRDFSGGMEMAWPLWLPLPHLRRSRRARRWLDRTFSNWIRHRRENPADPPDFFQNLIDATLADGTPIPDELTVNLILMLIWAGHETTTGQLAWTLIDLLQHPDYLDEVRDEVDGVLGDRPPAEIGWPEVGALARLECAVKESERLHPVAHVTMRRAAEDIRIGGCHVPKGMYVLAAPCVSHLMPEVFPDPHAYRPRRFERGSAATSLEANRLIGFGGGLHRCLGVNFARLEMKIVLALFARHYDMELLDPPRPVSGAASARWPAQPARVRYAARAASPPRPATEAVSAHTVAATGGCPFHGARS